MDGKDEGRREFGTKNVPDVGAIVENRSLFWGHPSLPCHPVLRGRREAGNPWLQLDVGYCEIQTVRCDCYCSLSVIQLFSMIRSVPSQLAMMFGRFFDTCIDLQLPSIIVWESCVWLG